MLLRLTGVLFRLTRMLFKVTRVLPQIKLSANLSAGLQSAFVAFVFREGLYTESVGGEMSKGAKFAFGNGLLYFGRILCLSQ